MLDRLRRRLTYGNVMSTLALFIALGGTSYALTLPRNSVGSRELKPRSVGASELKTGAVSSADLKDRGIRVRDISAAARKSLRGATGPQGPPGTTYFAVVNSGAGLKGGSAVVNSAGIGAARVDFASSVASCAYSATLAKVAGGATEDPPPGSSIVVSATGDGGVFVRTWGPANQPQSLPFHLIVAC